uniref:Uncharacterized protein n=1 Tax=Acrobeloides nanus TaxID=290746 RepID=A0A914C076_9BILA
MPVEFDSSSDLSSDYNNIDYKYYNNAYNYFDIHFYDIYHNNPHDFDKKYNNVNTNIEFVYYLFDNFNYVNYNY